jgi:hypothetical protein
VYIFKINQSLIKNGLTILCTGSIFKSWQLIKAGFIKSLKIESKIKKMKLIAIKTDSTIGAVLLASAICDCYDDLMKSISLNDYLMDLDHINIDKI